MRINYPNLILLSKPKTKNARLNKQSGKHPEQKDPISLSRRQSLASVQPVLTKLLLVKLWKPFNF